MRKTPDEKTIAAYNSADFQRLFGVGNTKMHEEIREGRLKARYVGRKLLITHDDATAWLQSLPERTGRPSKQREAA